MNLESLAPNDNYFQEVAENVWLMDNHKWAIYVWERHRQSTGVARFSLLHVDYHWDAIDDFSGRPDAEERLLAADLPTLKAMVKDEDGIQYDSFIAPAVRRGMFDELHFYCKQDDGVDVGIDERLCAQVGTKQFVHNEMENVPTLRFKSPLILDICLDLFNDSDYFGEGKIWSDDGVIAFMELIREIVRNAALVTVSLSFEYSGTHADTRQLASLVLPRIIEWRRQPAE